MSTDKHDTGGLAEKIMEYFKTHPNAADNVEGILKWWLGEQACGSTEQDVLHALEHLYQSGAVEKTIGQTGKAIYSCAKPVS